jgi:hypothetical protein
MNRHYLLIPQIKSGHIGDAVRPKINRQMMRRAVSAGRDTGASVFNDK